MCKIYSGAMISNWQDVQNLVIGIILRQQQEYCIENILHLVERYMEGSSVIVQEKQLRDIIAKNLNLLYIRNKVRCKNGYYVPQPIKHYHYN